MEKERLFYLIDKYCNGLAGEQEQQELDDWYNQIDYGTQGLQEWIRTTGNSRELIDKLYDNFKHRLKTHQPHIRKIYRVTAMAASLLLLVTLGIVLNDLLKKQSPPTAITAPIVPGREQAVLTLASGQKIILDTQKTGIIYSQQGVAVSKNNQGEIVYSIATSHEVEDNTIAYNSIETPRGGRYQVKLPDGTAVWLNAATKLTYPIRFSATERRVEMLGEAYFEVAPNKQHPFTVISGNQQIQVLGTHFNVNAYENEESMRTTLLEGSVKVSQSAIGNRQSAKNTARAVVLKPGEQAVMAATHSPFTIHHSPNINQVMAWKNGYFLFDDMDIKSIMKVISRWYDVDVMYTNVDPHETFGGSFSRDAALSEILQNLQAIGKVHFKITHRTITVTN